MPSPNWPEELFPQHSTSPVDSSRAGEVVAGSHLCHPGETAGSHPRRGQRAAKIPAGKYQIGVSQPHATGWHVDADNSAISGQRRGSPSSRSAILHSVSPGRTRYSPCSLCSWHPRDRDSRPPGPKASQTRLSTTPRRKNDCGKGPAGPPVALTPRGSPRSTLARTTHHELRTQDSGLTVLSRSSQDKGQVLGLLRACAVPGWPTRVHVTRPVQEVKAPTSYSRRDTRSAGHHADTSACHVPSSDCIQPSTTPSGPPWMRHGVPGGAGGGGLPDAPVGRSFSGIPAALVVHPTSHAHMSIRAG